MDCDQNSFLLMANLVHKNLVHTVNYKTKFWNIHRMGEQATVNSLLLNMYDQKKKKGFNLIYSWTHSTIISFDCSKEWDKSFSILGNRNWCLECLVSFLFLSANSQVLIFSLLNYNILTLHRKNVDELNTILASVPNYIWWCFFRKSWDNILNFLAVRQLFPFMLWTVIPASE